MKAKTLIFGIAATAISLPTLSAQSYWVGGGSNDSRALWSNSANWTGTLPANSSSIALVLNNTAANSFSNNDLTGLTLTSISVPASFNSINIKDNNITGNAVTLGGNITIDTGNWQTFGFGMDLSATRTVTVNNGQLTLSGNLTGANGGITKGGGGTLIISGNNSLGAGTRLTINGGTVYLDSTSALGASGGIISMAGGAALSFRTDSAINSYNLTGGSTGTASSVTLGRQNSGAAYTQNFGVLELGSRTMTFNQGGNINSGTMVANISELRMTAGNNDRPVLLNGTATIQVGSASITNNALTKRLQLDGTSSANSIGAISNGLSGATIEVIKDNSSTWTLTANNSYTGTTTITGGVLQLGNGGTTGALSTSSAITNNATLAFNRSNTITQGTDFASTIAGTGSLRKSGAGNLILTGANLGTGAAREVLAFSGAGSGTVTLQNTAALGSEGNTVRFAGNGSGVLDLQTDGSVNAYNIASGSGHGGTVIANRATSGSSVNHTLGSLDLSSVTLTINKGSNVTGSAAVSFAELKMTGGNDNNPVTLAGDAEITLGSASITSTGISKRLQLDGTSANNVVSGVISDTNNATTGAVVNLIKANSSTWTLSSANTYTGDTTIKGGTLAIGSAGTIANSPKIIVGDAGSTTAVLDVSSKSGGFAISAAQTLGGIGTIDANASGTLRTVTIEGKHAPGNSAGIQTVDGNLSYASNSIFEWELTANTASQGASPNHTFDQVAVTGGGTLSIAADAKFRIILNSAGSNVDFTDSFWASDRSWSIFTGAGSLTGFTLDSVSNDKNGAAFSAIRPNGSFSITGSTLTWTAVPEPTSALAGLLITAGLLRRRRGA